MSGENAWRSHTSKVLHELPEFDQDFDEDDESTEEMSRSVGFAENFVSTGSKELQSLVSRRVMMFPSESMITKFDDVFGTISEFDETLCSQRSFDTSVARKIQNCSPI